MLRGVQVRTVTLEILRVGSLFAGALSAMVSEVRELLVRWNANRGWWLDAGFGIAEDQAFFDTLVEAICAGYAVLARESPNATLRVQDGAYWREADPPVLLDWPPRAQPRDLAAASPGLLPTPARSAASAASHPGR